MSGNSETVKVDVSTYFGRIIMKRSLQNKARIWKAMNLTVVEDDCVTWTL